MLGPGEYVPDVTEGISHVEDLPKPSPASITKAATTRRAVARAAAAALAATPAARAPCTTWATPVPDAPST